ncbi:MAG: hypothetical protein ACI4RA_11340 [Kiritimatiellia bacterium]
MFFAFGVLAGLLVAPHLAAGGVYDDAIFWFRGGKTVGTGADVKLFDEIHASDTTHANHGAQFKGLAESRAIVEEDVKFPCGRDEPIRTKVLRLSYDPQIEGSTTNVWMNWASAEFLRPQFSNEYTMVMRLKCQASPATNATQWLTRFGYVGGKAVSGILFGLRGNDATTNRVLLCCYPQTTANGGVELGWGQTALRVPPTNVWFDVSLMVSNNVLRVGIARPDVYWNRNAIEFVTISSKAVSTPITGPDWRFFAENGDGALKDYASAYKGTFVGSVQQIAIWNHALSDDEIREAWGSPGADLWRVGLANDAANEFAADSAPASQTIDPHQGWSAVSPRLAAGATWTVPFHGMANEAGFAQIFRLTPTSASAEGLVAVAVNGTPLGSKAVRKGKATEWYAAGTLFKEGDNALTLTRTDSNAGDVVVDAMALGGSWQVGSLALSDWRNLQTEVYTDLVPTTRIIARRQWPQANNLNAWTSNRTYRVWVPKSVAERYPTAFGFYVKAYDMPKGSTGYLDLSVNGERRPLLRTYQDKTTTVERADSTAGVNRVYYETNFEPGELKEGWNEFALLGSREPADATSGYFLFNAFRWFITGHPANGTLLILR